MTDIVNQETRSRMMSGIKSKNTKPEMTIRKGLHALGLRYRIHVKTISGHPDIVFSKFRAVIFINGCFWHGHDCPLFRLPSTRRDFWDEKINRNRKRDEEVKKSLDLEGWRQLTVWECAIRGHNTLDVEKVINDISFWIMNGSSNHQIRGSFYGIN